MKNLINILIGNVLNLFIVNKPKRKGKIRKVYFGLRTRLLGLLSVSMIVILLLITIVMKLNQMFLLRSEQKENATGLVQIMSEHAINLFDVDSKTTREERIQKYNTIKNEASTFKYYNKNIIKIMLVDKKAKVRFSTYEGDLGKKFEFSYFKKALSQNEEKTHFKKKKIGKDKFEAVAYPIFLKDGYIPNVLKDYEEIYPEYSMKTRAEKNKIYLKLWNKYKKDLPDFFDPNTVPAPKGMVQEIKHAWDIDLLFLKLFLNIKQMKRLPTKKGEDYLWKYKWLFDEKNNKLKAINDDNLDKANKFEKKIKERMQYLYSQAVEGKKLGAIAILFDTREINKEMDKGTNFILIIALVMFILSFILFFFIVDILVKDLKRLESWGLTVSGGDLGSKIHIGTRDEVGRLSDIFNNMLDDIVTKFHLEKFVSKSTRNMIKQKKDTKSSVNLGRVSRKNLAFIFSDVRGFTSFSEKNDPETVIELLNMYFEIQSRIIKAKKGDIDDYVGDEIMAHFGGAKRADTAIKVAIEISKEIKAFNQERQEQGLPFFQVGIGINGGDVVVGNIGSSFRMDFACIGDTVNLASRLCSNAKPGEILVSKDLFKKAKGKYKTEKIAPIAVKGKAMKIDIVKIVG